MKAVVWEEKNKISVREVDNIKPGNHIVIKVKYTGICGGDIMIKSGKHPRAVAPLVLGHEFTGTIHHLPEAYKDKFVLGERVVVNPLISCRKCRQCLRGNEHVCENLQLIGIERNPGAFTEYVEAEQVDHIHRLPDEVSDKEAALIEPLAVAVHAVNYAKLSPEDTVVVLGAGPIGLLTAQVARAEGAGKIYISEIEKTKVTRAELLGFEVIDAGKDIVKEVERLTGGTMADVTFDAAGVPQTAEQLISLTGIKGRIIVVAIHKANASILFRDLSYKELTIMGTRIYENSDFDKAINLIAERKIDLQPLITHIFPITKAEEAFETAQSDKEACKVLIYPND